MIERLKKINKLRRTMWLPLWRIFARCKGVDVHRSVLMNGFPLFRVVKGANITLGQGVKINSAIWSNPIISRSRSSLTAVVKGASISIEKNVGMSGVCLCAAQKIHIGEGSIIGADAMIIDTDFHQPLADWRWSNSAKETSQPIIIGRGCFIGSRAIILKGVVLGDGSVVAAGAVVTKNVPSEHVAYGNPAKVTPLSEKWLRSSIVEL